MSEFLESENQFECDPDKVFLEFKGGPLDGLQFLRKDWTDSPPGTEIVDKAKGLVYRFHLPSTVRHPVYTYRPNE